MSRKTLAWCTLFVNLLTAGAAFGWVVARPAETKVLLGSPRVSERMMQFAEKWQADAGTVMMPQVVSPELDIESDAPVLAEEVADAAGSQPANGAAKPAGPPPRKASGPPPRRREGDASAPADPAVAPVETTALGNWTRELPAEAPPPELYPFRVDRRKFPDSTNIQVELSVQNASGVFWKDATIVLKSQGHPRAVAFHVGTWRIDQVARISYVFPRGELESRMTLLRIVAVEGQRMESMLSEHISRKRSEIAHELGSKEDVREAVGSADVGAEAAKFEIAVPKGIEPIAGEPDLSAFPATEEGEKAKQLYATAHAAARRADEAIRAIVTLVNDKGVEALAAPEGQEATKRALDAKTEFDKAGLDLALLLSRSKDATLRGQAGRVNELSDRLFGLIDFVEGQMAPVAKGFSVGGR